MERTRVLIGVGVTVALAILACRPAAGPASGDDAKYTLKVPGGLDFAEFRGYEQWETIAVSHNGDLLAVILGNPAMIAAYKAGIPGNGKPFPDGARMAKVHYNIQKADSEPGQPLIPASQHDVDLMVKDSKRFGDVGGWGYAEFEYDPATKTFRPGTTTDMPPQANDARCGLSCHTLVRAKDYVFTRYQTK
jgi:Cytochrome P460